MFQIIGAMAEFERELIRERVKAGIKNARARGTRIGRPRANVHASRIAELRAQGFSWKKIAKQMGLGVGTRSGKQPYLLIILRLVAAIVPSFSLTSPVSSTLWLI